jgi:hypothetical protein
MLPLPIHLVVDDNHVIPVASRWYFVRWVVQLVASGATEICRGDVKSQT